MRPAPPFDDWPVQYEHPEFGYAWYAAPAVFVNQLHAERGTASVANTLHDLVDDILARRGDELREHGGLLIVHDWRRMKGYDAEARRVFLGRMKRREPGYLRAAVAVVRDTPLLRMAVQTANMLMALRVGGDLEMAIEPRAALRAHGGVAPIRRGWLMD